MFVSRKKPSIGKIEKILQTTILPMEGTIMDTKILEELEAACAEELNLAGGDLGTLEAAVKAKMQQLGQGLLQRLVQH